MLIQGRLLTDPDRPPEPGYLRIAPPTGERPAAIDEMRFGEMPTVAAPPDVGGRDRLIVPAFTDAHMHVPQIDSVGCDGMPLLEWLDRVIFPAESWWERGAAVPASRTTARRLLIEGTAGIAGYLTSHAEPSQAAVAFFADRTPMRFHLGRAVMDRNAPESLTREDVERQRLTPSPSPLLSALPDSSGGRHPDDPSPRRNVSANPRFAVACRDELLAEVGWALQERESSGGPPTFMQTHLAETTPECELIAELFPEAPHYTGVYGAAKLLGPRSLLAHGIYLSDDELRLIAERDAVIVHCPTANLFLGSGLFDFDRAREHGVRVALGSDIAGGPDAAMPRVARAAIETAKIRMLTGASPVYVPSPAEVWRLITETNAAILGWPNAGVLREGAHADVLVLRVPESWFDEHLVGRLIYNWSSDLIEARIIDGRLVEPAAV